VTLDALAGTPIDENLAVLHTIPGQRLDRIVERNFVGHCSLKSLTVKLKQIVVV
jgi:hypothetical protein